MGVNSFPSSLSLRIIRGQLEVEVRPRGRKPKGVNSFPYRLILRVIRGQLDVVVKTRGHN